MAEPEKYEPVYGGWCAWAMLDKDKVKINPETFKIINVRDYVFYNGLLGNTLKKWNDKAAKSSDTALVNQADANWKKLIGR